STGTRMLAAIVPFGGATWFFKFTGPDAVVAGAKPEFLAFLETVRPPAAAVDLAASPSRPEPAPPFAAGNMANTAVVKAEGPGLQWTAPAHWQNQPAAAMRKATYAVTGDDGATADVSITAFPGDVGGEFANVNRWRSQLGLPPLAESALDAAITRRAQAGLHLTIVDFAGAGPAAGHRLLGAIVPFDNATWFFKLTGPDALVARERDAFLEFLGTIKAP
ncbi:MAG TPA: hypothetical protein VG710_07875, partial [Opitutus sp.]|nr:hypothetical protein [Opitutus sp.]